MYTGRSHFLDNSLADIKSVAASLRSNYPRLAHELEMDYKQGVLDEAGGLLYSASRTGPKYLKSGKYREGSDRITFNRNKFEDLPIEDRIRVVRDNIDNYRSLIASKNMSEDALQAQLRPHNPNRLIYDDLTDIFYESVDSNTGIHQGPGQVGSPKRNGGSPFPRPKAIHNAVQFFTEPPTDRLLHTHVSFPQQGHIRDAHNNPALARDLANMRSQQAAPNQKDGAEARGLVNLTTEENLERGLRNEISDLLELIDERLGQEIGPTEAANLIDLARRTAGKGQNRHAVDALAILAGSP